MSNGYHADPISCTYYDEEHMNKIAEYAVFEVLDGKGKEMKKQSMYMLSREKALPLLVTIIKPYNEPTKEVILTGTPAVISDLEKLLNIKADSLQ